jgi:hypothetical protein
VTDQGHKHSGAENVHPRDETERPFPPLGPLPLNGTDF